MTIEMKKPGALVPFFDEDEEFKVIRHASPEAIQRAYWEPICEEEGMTYEEVLIADCGGYTSEGTEVEFTSEDAIEGMRMQGCWGFINKDSREIHIWYAPDCDRMLLIDLLGHELGHLTGEPCQDDLEEEFRADSYGYVARKALQLLDQITSS